MDEQLKLDLLFPDKSRPDEPHDATKFVSQEQAQSSPKPVAPPVEEPIATTVGSVENFATNTSPDVNTPDAPVVVPAPLPELNTADTATSLGVTTAAEVAEINASAIAFPAQELADSYYLDEQERIARMEAEHEEALDAVKNII